MKQIDGVPLAQFSAPKLSGKWTGAVATVTEPFPVTFPILWSQDRDKVVIPDDVLFCQSYLNVKSVWAWPRSAFEKELRKWPVSPGMKPKHPSVRLGADWKDQLHDVRCIAEDTIMRGVAAVPAQKDGWSCGVNSIARMMAMLGHHVPNYERFLECSPKSFSFLGTSVGPQPKALREHLERTIGKLSPRAGENCNGDFSFHAHLFETALGQGRPSMVLYQTGDTNLHWVNLLGFHKVSGNAFVLDTNGDLQVWEGGRDELWGRMWIAHHAACKFGYLSPYNSITRTNGEAKTGGVRAQTSFPIRHLLSGGWL